MRRTLPDARHLQVPDLHTTMDQTRTASGERQHIQTHIPRIFPGATTGLAIRTLRRGPLRRRVTVTTTVVMRQVRQEHFRLRNLQALTMAIPTIIVPSTGPRRRQQSLQTRMLQPEAPCLARRSGLAAP